MYYRADIDGLRAIAVLSVILFHLGFSFLSGGYVGVDIFFVISGYLITGLIYNEIQTGSFSYIKFYKRRIARLLPALIITLFMVLLFGFFFYNNQVFDNLGKEVLFSSLGMANILFGQGINYFVQDEAVRPLIHLWSLGVEEQFYFIWPTLLIVMVSSKIKKFFPPLLMILILMLLSLCFAIDFMAVEPTKAYFYPQYRAFELLLGALTALLVKESFFDELKLTTKTKEAITCMAIVLMVLPMFILTKESPFPGFNTLIPILGTALFIAFAYETASAKLLSLKPIVFVGLISYPLYLYHQPIISYLHFFHIAEYQLLALLMVLSISIPLAWLTYKYIEKPIRKIVHTKNLSSKPYILGLLIALLTLGSLGMFIAKNNGIEKRFKLLNPFAYVVSQQSATTFHEHFLRGFHVAKDKKKILFVGDSVLQHFAYPITQALGINNTEIDTVTRGGCVLLKGVEFKDPYALSDISCQELNDKLYGIDKQYDYIIFSQNWSTYNDTILNAKSKEPIQKWEPFIEQTLQHFEPLSKKIIIIGLHPDVSGTAELKPKIFLSKEEYLSSLNSLKISNLKQLQDSRRFFDKWKSDKIATIHPIDIFYKEDRAILHDDKWSFFSDKCHISKASNRFVIDNLPL
jgi:peptidoglycan/LPS O-acetylase OafA/YrhL